MALHVVVRAGMMAGQVAVSQNAVTPARPQIQTPEELFSAIDGRDLSILGRHWRVEVFSVSEIGGHRYVQLALRGGSDHMLTLRVMPDAEPYQLIPRLLTWLARPGLTGEIVDVP